LRTVLRAIAGSGGSPGVHCCAPVAPVAFAREAGADWVSVDLTIDQDEEQLGDAVEAGTGLVAGVVDAAAPSDPRRSVEPVRTLWKRLGLDPDGIAHVAVSPTCGLAGAAPDAARAALRTCRDAAAELAS
jgi:hypothetical protein